MLETLLIIVFCLGYLCIILEHPLRLDKGASAILAGCLCWAMLGIFSADTHAVMGRLGEHVSDIAGIIFFLVGAMTIVEMVDLHGGFEIVKRAIKTRSPLCFLWIISTIAFLLSGVLDNLTTSIVMCSLLMKLLTDRKQQLLFAGFVIIAANSGGAWSPIGDVTTTMLWIGGQITALSIMKSLFLPSVVSLVVPLLAVSPFLLKAPPLEVVSSPKAETHEAGISAKEGALVFFAGIGLLIFVPVFKMITHLPPFMGMGFSLGMLWLLTEFMHKAKDSVSKARYSVVSALKRIDTPSGIFFLGILLAVASLEEVGFLHDLANGCDKVFGGNDRLIAGAIGVLSAIIDNVPLVAASMGMYPLQTYPPDHEFWDLIAFCAGTGGSMLVIGSAAGVAAMGIVKIDFFWYLKYVAPLAVIGYLAGIGTFILTR